MKLYHGTTAAALPAILTEGIKPRARKGGNWKRCPSKNGLVYLTTAYPLYFAACAISATAPKSRKKAEQYAETTALVVVEVETDRLATEALCPDEDFIAQALLQNRKGGRLSGDKALDAITDLCELTNAINPLEWAEHWQLSAEGLGNCAHYGTVGPEAITRYAVIDPKTAAPIIGEALEPTITTQNYRFVGGYYRGLVAFVFGDAPTLPSRQLSMLGEEEARAMEEAAYAQLPPEQAAYWKQRNAEAAAAMLRARDEGVTVTAVGV